MGTFSAVLTIVSMVNNRVEYETVKMYPSSTICHPWSFKLVTCLLCGSRMCARDGSALFIGR